MQTSLVLLCLICVAASGFSPTAAADLTVVSWGGVYTKSQQKAYGDTWPKGDQINGQTYNGGLGEIRT